MNPILNKTKLPLLGLSAMLFALPLTGACSAGDSPTEGAGGEGPAAVPLAPVDEPSPAVQALGGAGNEGAYLVENPVFGQGSYTGVDMSDLCNSAPIWEVDIAMSMETGAQTVYDGKVWEITGIGVPGAFTQDVCTPTLERPATNNWCFDQCAWVIVKECE